MRRVGRHFLQVPGPSNIPDRVLRAIDQPIIDHRGPDFAELAKRAFAGMKEIFNNSGSVFIFPGSGTGAWEAALANCLSPGDKVLMYETGHFSSLWRNVVTRFGLEAVMLPGDWRTGVDADAIEKALRQDSHHLIKAVCVVHNETSTGCISSIADVRQAMDGASHPALLMVDAVSSLGSIEFRQDGWGVDVAVAASQKGLMLPSGLGFTSVSAKALEASKTARLPRSFWAWDEMAKANADGFFPYTPATNLIYGLVEAFAMMREEGMERVFARHERLGEATRRAVRAWDLEIQCSEPRHYSPVVTGVRMPDGQSADGVRKIIDERFNMSLGAGLSKLADKVFRIGHLGDFNELMLAGALSGVEMGLHLAGVKVASSGIDAALAYLKQNGAGKN